MHLHAWGSRSLRDSFEECCRGGRGGGSHVTNSPEGLQVTPGDPQGTSPPCLPPPGCCGCHRPCAAVGEAKRGSVPLPLPGCPHCASELEKAAFSELTAGKDVI